MSLGQVISPLPVPSYAESRLVVPPPGDTPGHWAGAPSACLHDGVIYLAYRLRRPTDRGRGYAVVVARSRDGERFETVSVIDRERLATDSLERPALAVTADGVWRLYLSCATPGTKHWRVEVLEAPDPSAFDPAAATVALPGGDSVGVKDPVIIWQGDKWHLWASCHPLDDPDHTDRMVTDYATSADGLEWMWQGTVLSGRAGSWDARGVRVTSVISHRGETFAYYDGRASAAENYEERTGIAVGEGFGTLVPQGTAPIAESPYGGLRYVSVVETPEGDRRFYYEATRADGAHELRTELHRGLSQSE
jgi:hypothetical protein